MPTGIYNHQKHSKETLEKMRKPHKKMSLETRKKMSLSKSKDKNYNWKGEDTAKITKHIFVAKYKPKPKCCEFCGEERKLNLANINGHQYTKNIDDYKWLCYSCHKKMDIGDYCKRGHKLDGMDSRGKRYCKECRKEINKKYRDKLAGDKLVGEEKKQ